MIEVFVKPEDRPPRALRYFKEALVIGRDPVCDLYIDDRSASRRHARVYADGEHLFLEDLGSQNGVYRGTQRISDPTPIEPEEEFLIGHTRLRFALREETAPNDVLTLRYRENGQVVEIALEGTHPYLIGRSAVSDIQVDDPQVSLRHARIEFVEGQFHLIDAGSINGCFVNDQRVENVILHPGDRMQIGGTVLVVMDPLPAEAGPEVGEETVAERRPPLAERETPTMPLRKLAIEESAAAGAGAAGAAVDAAAHTTAEPPAQPVEAISAEELARERRVVHRAPAGQLSGGARPTERRSYGWLVLLLLLALGGAGGYLWWRQQAAAAPSPRLRGRQVFPVAVPREIDASAQLAPHRVRSITVESPAVLAQYAVEAEARVQAGEVIAFLEAPPDAGAAAAAGASPSPAPATGLQSAFLAAPIAGVVYDLRIHPGDLVRPGETVASVGDVQRLVAEFGLVAEDLEQVPAGGRVMLEDAAGGRRLDGVVENVSSRADPASGLYRVLVAVENADGALAPGLALRWRQSFGMTQALAIPANYVVTGPAGTAVWLAQGDAAALVPLELGRRVGELQIVVRGLREGDVVIEPAPSLRQGLTLRLVQ